MKIPHNFPFSLFLKSLEGTFAPLAPPPMAPPLVEGSTKQFFRKTSNLGFKVGYNWTVDLQLLQVSHKAVSKKTHCSLYRSRPSFFQQPLSGDNNQSTNWAVGLDPHPFYFTPTLFIKAPLILKIPDPHPFSNFYVSYIHFWCHGNVVD